MARRDTVAGALQQALPAGAGRESFGEHPDRGGPGGAMRSRQGTAKPDVVGRGAPGRSRHSATRDGPRAREKGNSKVRWGIMAVLLSSCDGASSWQRARIV